MSAVGYANNCLIAGIQMSGIFATAGVCVCACSCSVRSPVLCGGQLATRTAMLLRRAAEEGPCSASSFLGQCFNLMSPSSLRDHSSILH